MTQNIILYLCVMKIVMHCQKKKILNCPDDFILFYFLISHLSTKSRQLGDSKLFRQDHCMAYHTKGLHLQLLMAVIMHRCFFQHGLQVTNKKLSFQSALGSLNATTT